MSKNRTCERKTDIGPRTITRPVFEALLGSKTKVRILRLLCTRPEREFTLRELSLAVDQSLGSVSPAVEQLLGTRILLTRRVGRSRALRVNRNHPLYDPLATLFRQEASALVGVAQAFADALPRQGVEAVVLFGSAARGQPSVRSDIDVLVVVDDPRRAGAIRSVAASMLDRFDANVSPLVLTSGETSRRLTSFDPLLETIAAEGRLLRGRATWLGR